MNPIIRVLIGLAVIIVGFLIVWKTDSFQSWFGEIPWAEKTFGGGGTRTFYKLLGVAVAFIGMMIVTNLISGILSDLAALVSPRGA